MKEKITVQICTGTLCYVMGGSDLQLLDEHLSPELLAQVDIKGSPCLECCTKNDAGKAPFVMIGEKIISEATISKVIEEIKTEIAQK